MGTMLELWDDMSDEKMVGELVGRLVAVRDVQMVGK